MAQDNGWLERLKPYLSGGEDESGATQTVTDGVPSWRQRLSAFMAEKEVRTSVPTESEALRNHASTDITLRNRLRDAETAEKQAGAAYREVMRSGDEQARKEAGAAVTSANAERRSAQAEYDASKVASYIAQKNAQYASVRENSDFRTQSEPDADVMRLGQTGHDAAATLYWQINSRGQTKYKNQPSNYITDEEARTFNYLYNTRSEKDAMAYYDYIERDLNSRRETATIGKYQTLAEEKPAAANALSVGANLVSGVGIADAGLQMLENRIQGDPRGVDYASGGMLPGKIASTIRETRAKNIAENHPFEIAGTNVASFLYQTGMSMADSAVVLGLSAIGAPAAVTLLGGSAATQAALEVKARGGGDGQALAYGIAAGINEMLFEKISLEALLKPAERGFAKGIRNVLKQAFTEGSEEVNTSVANALADYAISLYTNGGQTAIQSRAAQLRAQYQLSEADAMKASMNEWMGGLVTDFLGGFISGGVMGGAKVVGTNVVGATQDARIAALKTRIENATQNPAPVQNAEPRTGAVRETVSPAVQNTQEQTEVPDVRDTGAAAESERTIMDAPEAEEKAGEGVRNAAPTVSENRLTNAERSAMISENAEGEMQNERTEAAEPATAERTAAEPERGGQDTNRSAERGTGLADSGAVQTVSGAKRFLQNYVEQRNYRKQRSSARELSAAAETAGLRQISAREMGVEYGTDTKQNAVLTRDLLTPAMRRRQAEFAARGIQVDYVIGLVETQETGKDAIQVRGAVSSDGKHIWVTANHPNLSWEKILDHEEFHTIRRQDAGIIDRTMQRMREDPKVSGHLEETLRRYEELYQPFGVEGDEVIEEMLADYYAGYDATRLLDTDKYMAKTVRKTVQELRRDVDRGSAVSAADESRASREFDRKYFDAAVTFNKKSGRIDSVVLQRAGDVRNRIREKLDSVADEANLPEDKTGNTYFGNNSYSGSEESTTVCIRSLAIDSLTDAVAEAVGRPLTVEESVYIAQQAFNFTNTPQCLYCYVAMDRMAKRKLLGDYLSQREAVVRDLSSGMSKADALASYKKREKSGGKQWSKAKQERFDLWAEKYERGSAFIREKDVASDAAVEQAMRNPSLKDELEDALRYAQDASWAKKRVGYTAYNNHILKWGQSRIDDLNSQFGLRMYSFSDYSPAFVLENMQMVTDAAARGLKMLAYTKELDFVRIFAGTGMNINVSIFGYGNGSNMDAMQGADWVEARELRGRYDNVGITFVATNDAQIEWALKQSWIDVVIPFHMVKTGKTVADLLGYKNYTGESSDRKTKAWRGSKNQKEIYPSMHNNDKDTYLRLLEENNLRPRFERWIDNPNYMKLVNETRRSAQDTPPVQPVFDEDAAMRSIDRMVRSGGYNVPIGGTLENLFDIAQEMAETVASGVAEDLKRYREANDRAIGEGMDSDESSDMTEDSRSLETNGARFSRDIPAETLSWLEGLDPDNKDDVIRVYRTMQIRRMPDGRLALAPPMADLLSKEGNRNSTKQSDVYAYVSDDGENITETFWFQADENPDMADENGRIRIWKDAKRRPLVVAYNPYNHGSQTMLNDQFDGAYERPELVTVEAIVPRSEESRPYHAEKAKDPVGWTDWKAGTVSTEWSEKSGGKREVFLSRWLKPIRIVPVDEVAESIYNMLNPYDVKIPANVVNQQLRDALIAIDPEIVAEPKAANARKYYEYQRKTGRNDDTEKPQTRNSIEFQPEAVQPYTGGLSAERRSDTSSEVPSGRKISRVRSNALNAFYNDVEANMDGMRREDYPYDPVNEKESIATAKQRIAEDFDGWAERLAEDDRQWDGKDVDTAMGILYNYRQDARMTGDYRKVISFSRVIQKHGTRGGEEIQAFAKYSRTATYQTQKAAEKLYNENKLNPAQQKRLNAYMKAIDSVIENDSGDAAKAVTDRIEAGAKSGDARRTDDALNVIREIYENVRVQRDHGEPVENWIELTGEKLAQELSGRLKPPKSRTKTTMQTILGDMIRFMNEHAVPKRSASANARTATARIADYINNRDAYAEVWATAQRYLRAQYADDPAALDALEAFLTGTISYNADAQHFDRTMYDAILETSDGIGLDVRKIRDLAAVGLSTQTVERIADEFVRNIRDLTGEDTDRQWEPMLRDAVTRHIRDVMMTQTEQEKRLGGMIDKTAKELNMKLGEILTQSKGDKRIAAAQLTNWLVSELGVRSSDAAIAAKTVTDAFMAELAERSDRRLRQMFSESGETQPGRKERNRLMELFRLGGFENQNVEDAVVDALGIGNVSRAKQRQIVSWMASFADTLDSIYEGDTEALKALIREQAAIRNTKLSRTAEKVLEQEQDFRYLYDFAMSQLKLIAGDFNVRSFGSKVSTVQTISHLLNIRTAKRNLISNQVYDLVASAANNVAILPDIALGRVTGSRTVGLDKSWASREKRLGAAQGARRSYLEISLDVNPKGDNASKYGTKGRTTFAAANSRGLGRILNLEEKVLGYELNTTDEFHKGSVRGETRDSLRRYVERGDLTRQEMEDFAESEALSRSFQDDTAIGNLFSLLKNSLNTIGFGDSGKRLGRVKVKDYGLGDMILKYTQVPGALIHRAIEFSPIGYAKALCHIVQIRQAVNRGERATVPQRKAALAIGQATTGTGLILLFMALAKGGLLRRDDEKDKNAKAAKNAQGLSGTQLNVSALIRAINGGKISIQDGDVLLDIGFLEPLDTLMTVATLLANEDELGLGDIPTDTLEGIWRALEDTSAMQTISSIVNVVQYHDEENDLPLYAEIPIEIASSNISGFISAPIRQLAQATDTVYRDQYRSQKAALQIGAKLANSVPGARQILAPKITPLGRDKTYQKPALNALNALVTAGNVSVYRADKVVDELNRVYAATGDAKMWAERNAPYTVTVETGQGKEQLTLTPDERTAYQRSRGQLTERMISQTADAAWYKKLDAETQAEALNWIGNFANHIAKSEMLDGRGIDYSSRTYGKYAAMLGRKTYPEIVREAMSKSAGLIIAGVPTKDADRVSQMSSADARSYLIDADMTDAEKLSAYGVLIGTETATESGAPTQWAKVNTAVDDGVSVDDALRMAQEDTLGDYMKWRESDAKKAGIESDIYIRYRTETAKLSADKGKDGKSISGSKKRKVVAYIHKLKLTAKQKDVLYLDAGYTVKDLGEAPWHRLSLPVA